MGRLRKRIGRTIATLAALVTTVAVVQQLRLPPAERSWHGRILGVPYDFRPPTFDRIQRSWWNPENPSLFTERAFGVGWSINFYRLMRLLSPGS